MHDIYDYEYDDRTWMEKYHDDNTWQKDTGLVAFDGRPYWQWCMDCNKPVRVRQIEGRNVFDSYDYLICAECESLAVRVVTEEEAEEHNLEGDIG